MNAPDAVDVVALGESMVTFLPSRPGRLADVPSFDRGIGGAESNVACVLAAAGHSVRWVSRVGADGFGDHLVETVGGYGVDVSAVRRDPSRPTGVYFRTAGDRATDAHEVAYYRAGSAASAMSVANTDLPVVRAARVLHLSGITAALSEDCLGLLRELTAAAPGRPLVSFDVNHRVGLWHDADGPRVLLELARRADIVFVGEDEAEEAWGITGGPDAIRTALPEPEVLVVKQGGTGATAFVSAAGGRESATSRDGEPAMSGGGESATSRGGAAHRCRPAPVGDAPSGISGRPGSPSAGAGEIHLGPATAPGSFVPAPGEIHLGPATAPGSFVPARGTFVPAPGTFVPSPATAPGTFVPAPAVDVVATTGAGDAFAAGFLSATLRDLPLRDRMRHGHLWAAAALTAPGDLAAPPSRAHADRLVAVADTTWETLRLGPGWTQADRAPEEVRTP